MTLPLHPRRATVYFHNILGRTDNLRNRLNSFQEYYILSMEGCKTTPIQCIMEMNEEEESSVYIQVNENGDGITLCQDKTDLSSIQFVQIEYISCSLDENGHTCIITYQDDARFMDITLHFPFSSDDIEDEFNFAQWMMMIISTATALRHSSCKSLQLLWQAARLRILELTCLLGMNSTYRQLNPSNQVITFIEAIKTTQDILQEMSKQDISIDLNQCLFLRAH